MGNSISGASMNAKETKLSTDDLDRKWVDEVSKKFEINPFDNDAEDNEGTTEHIEQDRNENSELNEVEDEEVSEAGEEVDEHSAFLDEYRRELDAFESDQQVTSGRDESNKALDPNLIDSFVVEDEHSSKKSVGYHRQRLANILQRAVKMLWEEKKALKQFVEKT